MKDHRERNTQLDSGIFFMTTAPGHVSKPRVCIQVRLQTLIPNWGWYLLSDQQQSFLNLVSGQRDIGQGWMRYWQQYSNFSTWEFWVTLLLLVIPLVVLYLKLDREKAFRIAFYGFAINLCETYIDGIGGFSGLWGYPYKVFPFLSMNLTVEASLIPVAYMLVYQWCINNHRNFYLYGTITSALFAFVIKPIFVWLNLFQMLRGMNYIYMFLLYIVGMLISKWVTDLFVFLQKRQGGEEARPIKWTYKNRVPH